MKQMPKFEDYRSKMWLAHDTMDVTLAGNILEAADLALLAEVITAEEFIILYRIYKATLYEDTL